MNADDYTLRNVRLLGFNSQNGRRYLPEAVSAALPLYAGAKVFLDHGANPHVWRSVKDLIGVVGDNPAMDAAGAVGEVVLNPQHPHADALVWIAKNKPGSIGLSHNCVASGKTEGGIFVVHEIVSVKSVDIVVDPATTKGLFA